MLHFAGQRFRQLHLHHPARRPDLRPDSRHLLHAGHRHVRRDLAPSSVLPTRPRHRRQDNLDHQVRHGAHLPAVLPHRQVPRLHPGRGDRQRVHQGEAERVGQGE